MFSRFGGTRRPLSSNNRTVAASSACAARAREHRGRQQTEPPPVALAQLAARLDPAARGRPRVVDLAAHAPPERAVESAAAVVGEQAQMDAPLVLDGISAQ
jgi:hypothetical protein